MWEKCINKFGPGLVGSLSIKTSPQYFWQKSKLIISANTTTPTRKEMPLSTKFKNWTINSQKKDFGPHLDISNFNQYGYCTKLQLQKNTDFCIDEDESMFKVKGKAAKSIKDLIDESVKISIKNNTIISNKKLA